MKLRVSLLRQAERDVDGILAWIGERSRSGAATWHRRWWQVLDSLSETADGCGLTPEDEDHTIDIRQIIFKTRRGNKYRALFTIQGDTVYIMHVRGPGQDLVTPDHIALPD